MMLAFPEKNSQEIEQLEKGFYHYFADLFAEIIHGYRMSTEEWRERVIYTNNIAFEEKAVAAGGAIAMLGHIGCWEWIAGYPDAAKSPLVDMPVVYKKLNWDSANQAMLELRKRRHCEPVEMKQLLRYMVKHRNDGKCHIYGILSDQRPMRNNLDCWTEFLNQDTPFITGSEILAKRFNFPVTYIDIRRLSRGHYEARICPITYEPQETEPGWITREYARLLEQNILRNPETWLWSHNRFKWKRSDCIEKSKKE